MLKTVRQLPFNSVDFRKNFKDFFNKNPEDYNVFFEELMKRQGNEDISPTLKEFVSNLRKQKKELTYDDISLCYSENHYVANKLLHEMIVELPFNDIIDEKLLSFSEWEYFKIADRQLNCGNNQKLFALDHGCANGTYGFALWTLGYNVTFGDIKAPYFDFLQYRCKKYDIDDIEFLNIAGPLKLEKDYDLIISFFVFEHLLDPIQHLKEIYDHLKSNGTLCIRCDFSGGGIHLDENKKRFINENKIGLEKYKKWCDTLFDIGFVIDPIKPKLEQINTPNFFIKNNAGGIK